MSNEMVERVARAICEENGYDPDHLEPGDCPYCDNRVIVDGHNKKGEPCYLFWRTFEWDARAAIEAMRELVPVVRENGEIGHLLVGKPVDIWQRMIDAALEDKP